MSGECADVLGMSLERMFGGLPHAPPSAPREILRFGRTLSSVSMCDLNRLRANVVFFMPAHLWEQSPEAVSHCEGSQSG